jgi:SH3-like domain-containing protein
MMRTLNIILPLVGCLFFPLSEGAEFVATRSNEAYLRAGPSKNYPIKWVYKHSGEPLEVIADFEEWKKVRDFAGDIGWISDGVITDARYGIINSTKAEILYKEPDIKSKKLLKLEHGVRVRIIKCELEWCQIKVDMFKGWLRKSSLWGAVN